MYQKRELKQRRRRRQQERQKNNSFRSVKQQLCKRVTLFCTFLCRRCTTATWNFLISRFVEDLDTRWRVSLSFLRPSWTVQSLRIHWTPKQFANIWRIERDGTKRDKVWSSGNSVLKCFRSPPRICYSSSLKIPFSRKMGPFRWVKYNPIFIPINEDW